MKFACFITRKVGMNKVISFEIKATPLKEYLFDRTGKCEFYILQNCILSQYSIIYKEPPKNKIPALYWQFCSCIVPKINSFGYNTTNKLKVYSSLTRVEEELCIS